MPFRYFDRADGIFRDTMALDPSERDTFVAKACGGDETLRWQVETLLKSEATKDFTNAANVVQLGLPGSNLSPGYVLNDRFKIIRHIASGGMGSVYEAEDLKLRERLALKTILGQSAHDPDTMERFKREIYLARKVTHVNVSRIFDFAEHIDANGVEIVFLTMELLPGQTLFQQIQSSGPMNKDEALPIIRQLAAGLSAAHQAGVVHRDFKTGNVILVPSDEGMRAVITDFGLAHRDRAGAGSGDFRSQTGLIAGSPPYMAPEQVTGAPTTQATDIYALGVVMFEMVTGTLPFTGENSLHKRLIEKPVSPRIYAPTLDPKWEQAILRCLELEAQDRFASANDVVNFLEGQKVAPAKRQLRRRITTAAILALLALAAASIYLRVFKVNASRQAIAVLGFQNLASRPEAGWVSTAVAEGLRAQLAAPGKMRTISDEDVADYKREVNIPNYASLGKQTLSRLHRLGADLIIVGSYVDLGKESGGKIRLNVEIQDTAKGETIDALSAEGSEKELTQLISETGSRLRDKLGMGGLSAEKETQLAMAQPSADAAPFYSEGLERLRSYDFSGAQQLLQKAIGADPNYAFAHLALAETWDELGFDGKAREEIGRAYQLSAKLQLEDRLSIEGRDRAINGDWNDAIESYGELYKHFPDNLEYGLHLAEAQRSAGKAQASLQTLTNLSKLPAPLGGDPRINLERAETALSIGSHREAQAAAMSAVDVARARGMRVLESRALSWACNAFEELGESKQAKALCQENEALSSSLGDKVGMARATNGRANMELNEGKAQDALNLFEKAFQIASGIGDRRDMAGALHNMANALAGLGRLTEAQQKYEAALAIEREIDNRTEQAKTLGNLANLASQRGDLTEAARQYNVAISLARQTGDREDLARTLTNLGGVLLDLGQLSDAENKLNEALSLRQQMGSKGEIATTLDTFGELRLAKGDLEGAVSAYNEALQNQNETGDKSWAATSQAGLAAVLIEEGNFQKAEALARSALAEFQAENDSEDETLSRLTLVRCLLAQKRVADAQTEIARLVPGISKLAPGIQIDVEIEQGWIAAESGNRSEQLNAGLSLHKAIADAAQFKMLGRELDGRLALAKLKSKLGEKAYAKAALTDILQNASRSGLNLIGRRAKAMASES